VLASHGSSKLLPHRPQPWGPCAPLAPDELWRIFFVETLVFFFIAHSVNEPLYNQDGGYYGKQLSQSNEAWIYGYYGRFCNGSFFV